MKPMLLAFAATILMTAAAPTVLDAVGLGFSTQSQTTTPGVRLD